MLIDNKLRRIVGIPVQKAPAGNGERVPYLMLRPGVNRVTESDWTIVKEHDDAKARMKKGTLVALETKGKDNFTAILDIDEMTNLVGRVADASLLKKMMKVDNRDEFVTAAEAQLKKLELPGAEA